MLSPHPTWSLEYVRGICFFLILYLDFADITPSSPSTSDCSVSVLKLYIILCSRLLEGWCSQFIPKPSALLTHYRRSHYILEFQYDLQFMGLRSLTQRFCIVKFPMDVPTSNSTWSDSVFPQSSFLSYILNLYCLRHQLVKGIIILPNLNKKEIYFNITGDSRISKHRK